MGGRAEPRKQVSQTPREGQLRLCTQDKNWLAVGGGKKGDSSLKSWRERRERGKPVGGELFEREHLYAAEIQLFVCNREEDPAGHLLGKRTSGRRKVPRDK